MSHHHDQFIWFLAKLLVVLVLITFIFEKLGFLSGSGGPPPTPSAATAPPPQTVPTVQPRRPAPNTP